MESRNLAAQTLRSMIDAGRSWSGHERNCCFLNLRNGAFATISAISGFDFEDDARAIAVVDWDHDGDLDMWVSNRNGPRLRLLMNRGQPQHHFLQLQLQGNGVACNRDAIGARVEVAVPGSAEQPLMRTLRAGDGFLSQSTKTLHFGLGQSAQAVNVTVHWPDGADEVFEGLEVDQHYRLIQGSGTAERRSAEPRRLALAPAPQESSPTDGAAQIRLLYRLPLPKNSYYSTFAGSRERIPYGQGKPVLVCLWASHCAPCLQELKEFTDREAEIRQAGLDVVALSVDGLNPESVARRDQTLIDDLRFPFQKGRAEGEFVQLLQGYHSLLVVLIKQLPVPTSVLIDGEGQLKVFYKGRVPIDDLLQQVEASPASISERIEWSAALPGRAIGRDEFNRRFLHGEARTLFALAEAFDSQGRLEDAERFYQGVLDNDPEFGQGHQKLATVLDRLGQSGPALEHYQRALALEGESAWLRLNIGVLLAKQEQFEQAEESLRGAIRMRPDYLDAHLNLAIVLARRQRYDEAAASLHQVLQINPYHTLARRLLSEVQAQVQGQAPSPAPR